MIKGLDVPFHAVFIRAPVISRIGEEVEVLAEVDRAPVAVRQGKHLGLCLARNSRAIRGFTGCFSKDSGNPRKFSN